MFRSIKLEYSFIGEKALSAAIADSVNNPTAYTALIVLSILTSSGIVALCSSVAVQNFMLREYVAKNRTLLTLSIFIPKYYINVT